MSLNLEHYRGTTFDDMPFTLKKNNVAINLTGTVIKMQLRKVSGGEIFLNLTSVASAGITITNAVGGVFKINKQIIDIEPFNYLYDIQITFPNGAVETWIRGFRFLVTDKITA
jgi:hypothetical protein